MTPKEKAEELVNKYMNIGQVKMSDYSKIYHPTARRCALIAVDETIRTLNEDIRDIDVRGSILLDLIDYWKEVKQEIEKL